MNDAERKALEDETRALEVQLAAGEVWNYVCRECGKTPQDIGPCDQCGYNRPYEKVCRVSMQ